MLVNEWGGGHQLKEEQRGAVPSSEDETETGHSQDKGFLKNHLDESSKGEMASEEQVGENILKKDENRILRKRDIEPNRKTRKRPFVKSVVGKSASDQAKRKQTQRQNANKRRKLQKSRQNGKSIKIYRKKEKVRMKVKGTSNKELREKPKKDNKRANQKKRVKDLPGKKVQGKNCGRSLRDTECFEKWAEYTSVGLALAPTVIKQVNKFFHISSHFLQVNSILSSDRTLIRKKAKKDDFLEHQSILQRALAANPCNGSKESTSAYGKPTPLRPPCT